MADYNVNMKQWNGSSFDNVLPLAFNSKALEGKSYDDIIQYISSFIPKLQITRYTGTGLNGSSAPNSVFLPFYPKIWIMPMAYSPSYTGSPITNFIPILLPPNLSEEPTNIAIYQPNTTSYKRITISYVNNVLTWYSSDPLYQYNVEGKEYNTAFIGGDDYVSYDTFIITESGNWKVPRSGKYHIELYGVGGQGYAESTSAKASGGSSCQSYDDIELTGGNEIAVTIPTTNTENTVFGSYSVTGGGNARSRTGGSASGNLGTSGVAGADSSSLTYSGGLYSRIYGYGASSSNTENAGKAAVYLKYLGE